MPFCIPTPGEKGILTKIMAKYKNWDELHNAFPADRKTMTDKQHIAFVEACFELGEKELSDKFWTLSSQYKSRNGQTFEIVRRYTTEDADLECLPMWVIRFPDGEELPVFMEEICRTSMQMNGCPFFPAVEAKKAPKPAQKKRTVGLVLDCDHSMVPVIIELKADGTPGDVYDSFPKFKEEHPCSSYRYGFCVIDLRTGYIPENCNDWNDNPEECFSDYKENAL